MNQAMISDFVVAIREERAPRVTGEDGHRTVETMTAACESARMGQLV